jgi:hypothetical protein
MRSATAALDSSPPRQVAAEDFALALFPRGRFGAAAVLERRGRLAAPLGAAAGDTVLTRFARLSVFVECGLPRIRERCAHNAHPVPGAHSRRLLEMEPNPSTRGMPWDLLIDPIIGHLAPGRPGEGRPLASHQLITGPALPISLRQKSRIGVAQERAGAVAPPDPEGKIPPDISTLQRTRHFYSVLRHGGRADQATR